MATVKPKFYVIGSALSLLKSLSKRPRGQFAFGFDVRVGLWQAQALTNIHYTIIIRLVIENSWREREQ